MRLIHSWGKVLNVLGIVKSAPLAIVKKPILDNKIFAVHACVAICCDSVVHIMSKASSNELNSLIYGWNSLIPCKMWWILKKKKDITNSNDFLVIHYIDWVFLHFYEFLDL